MDTLAGLRARGLLSTVASPQGKGAGSDAFGARFPMWRDEEDGYPANRICSFHGKIVVSKHDDNTFTPGAVSDTHWHVFTDKAEFDQFNLDRTPPYP